jgi:hypothetical protein
MAEKFDVADVDRDELVTLVLALFDMFDGYAPDPESGPDEDSGIFFDLPGGSGLVDYASILTPENLRTLRECLIARTYLPEVVSHG